MPSFLLRRLFYSALVLFGVVTLTFLLLNVLPGDPARIMLGQRADVASVAAITRELGLDQPLPVQYVRFLGRVVRGDLGRSFQTNQDVLTTILDRFPATALLAVSSLVLATVLGIALGLVSAVRRGRAADTAAMLFALVGISVPSFFAGLVIAWVFGYLLPWFPLSGYVSRGAQYLVLPTITLGLRPLSIIARLTRSSMLDVLGQDYIRTARAKGLGSWAVIVRHALRNALNPVVTAISSWVAALLAGAFFIELIFNWPGIGLLAVNAIQNLDFPMIQGTVLFSAVVFVGVNTLVDVLYVWLDPRVRLS